MTCEAGAVQRFWPDDLAADSFLLGPLAGLRREAPGALFLPCRAGSAPGPPACPGVSGEGGGRPASAGQPQPQQAPQQSGSPQHSHLISCYLPSVLVSGGHHVLIVEIVVPPSGVLTGRQVPADGSGPAGPGDAECLRWQP